MKFVYIVFYRHRHLNGNPLIAGVYSSKESAENQAKLFSAHNMSYIYTVETTEVEE